MSQVIDNSEQPSPPDMMEKKEETVEQVTHPRAGIPEWKWTGAFVAFLLTSCISGWFNTCPSSRDTTDFDRLRRE